MKAVSLIIFNFCFLFSISQESNFPENWKNDIPEKLKSNFRKSIDKFFLAALDPSFNTITLDKKDLTNQTGFIETYSTSIKIPGEKYNFIGKSEMNSKLDFVSVLYECKDFDENLRFKYLEYRRLLLDSYSDNSSKIRYNVNRENLEAPKDMSIDCPRGVIILDYCKNSNGFHSLQLKFIYQSEFPVSEK